MIRDTAMDSVAQRHVARRGFTLTEITVVLGIVGIVIGGIWSAAGMVRYNRLIQQEKSDLLLIVSGMRNLYAGKNFSSLDQANFFNWQIWDFTGRMVKYDIFPNDLPLDTTTAVNANPPQRGTPYNREGGRIAVWPFSNSPATTPSRVFEVEFFGVPRTCQRLAFEMSKLIGDLAPIYIYTENSGWVTPSASNFSTFDGCTQASFAFRLP